MTLHPSQFKAIAAAADDIADEASGCLLELGITATVPDVSASYARGVQDVLEVVLGVWDGYQLPDELAVIFERANVPHRVTQ